MVLDCIKRWFQNMLKEAFAGDVAMQVLMGQMRTAVDMAPIRMNTRPVISFTPQTTHTSIKFSSSCCKAVGSVKEMGLILPCDGVDVVGAGLVVPIAGGIL
ncbi:hypothetical protein ACQ4PT_057189 [Festuca glaucescens]